MSDTDKAYLSVAETARGGSNSGAFAQGVLAGEAGLTSASNPYADGSSAHREWRDGFFRVLGQTVKDAGAANQKWLTARRRGEQAGREGYKPDDNPFKDGTPEHQGWSNGYHGVNYPTQSAQTYEVHDTLPGTQNLTPGQRKVLTEAVRIVGGARREAYGTPEDNFARIARYWQAYFANTGREDVKIEAADVSPMMRLMKQARLDETPEHDDSLVDLIGYVLTQIHQQEARKE